MERQQRELRKYFNNNGEQEDKIDPFGMFEDPFFRQFFDKTFDIQNNNESEDDW